MDSQHSRKPYEKPRIEHVRLTPADAVLSACKDTASGIDPDPCTACGANIPGS